MNLITNYELDSTPNGNTVVAVRSNSSIKIRRDATYTRKQTSFNASTEVYSVPESGVTIRKDVANAEGNPSGQRLSAAVQFRLPVAVSSADLDELIVDLRAYVNDTELKNNLLKLSLPTLATESGGT